MAMTDLPAAGRRPGPLGLCDGTPAEGVVEDSGLEAPAAAFFAGGRDAGRHGRIDDRTAQRTSWMRIRLPAGSRKAQSRMPYGCSVGSWTTSASPACTFSKVPSRSRVASRIQP